jgi:hypothetical protein
MAKLNIGWSLVWPTYVSPQSAFLLRRKAKRWLFYEALASLVVHQRNAISNTSSRRDPLVSVISSLPGLEDVFSG